MATILAPPPHQIKAPPIMLVPDPTLIPAVQSPERQKITEVTEGMWREYLTEISDAIEDVSEITYRPGSPKRSFTVRMRVQFQGRGKPLPYPLDEEDDDTTEITYSPGPPKRSFTVRMRAQFQGRGKPLPYPLDEEE